MSVFVKRLALQHVMMMGRAGRLAHCTYIRVAGRNVCRGMRLTIVVGQVTSMAVRSNLQARNWAKEPLPRIVPPKAVEKNVGVVCTRGIRRANVCVLTEPAHN